GLFVPAGTPVYEGMIVGEYSRDVDLDVNVCREKKLTNMRAAGHDEAIRLVPYRTMDLEDGLEWIDEDELVEVTPDAIRLRKRELRQAFRPRGPRRGPVGRPPPVPGCGRLHRGGTGPLVAPSPGVIAWRRWIPSRRASERRSGDCRSAPPTTAPRSTRSSTRRSTAISASSSTASPTSSRPSTPASATGS